MVRIQIISTEATGGFITFGDNAAGFAGRIQYLHASNAMVFETAASEALRIDSSQNLRTYAKLGIRVDGDAIPWRGTAQIPAVINLAGNGALFTRPDNTFLSQNFYYNASDVGAVIDAGQASMIQLTPGEIIFSGSTTGASSNATISITERMRIGSNGAIFLSPGSGSYGLSMNDTNQVMNSGYIQGQQTVSLTYTCTTMSSMFIECVFNHYGYVTAYGCARVATFAVGPVITIQNILEVTSANGGSWTFNRVSNTEFTVAKTAGTYQGGGRWFVKINGARVFAA